MKTQTILPVEQNFKPNAQLTLVKAEKNEAHAKKLWLASLVSFLAKVFKPSDLTQESWQRLESHKYYRCYERESFPWRFHV